MRFFGRDAIIPPGKLQDYLLSTKHPDGRGKAEYLSGLGYTQVAFGRLEVDLRQQILTIEAEHGQSSPYGRSMRS